jgi:hypothetical protein
LIVYLSQDWNPDWGGALEFWSNDAKTNKPKNKIVEIPTLFNRAVLFDTTQDSWHGLPSEINCPEGFYRKSLAIYYLTDPERTAENRNRALFAPYKEQQDDPEILKFIEQRSK